MYMLKQGDKIKYEGTSDFNSGYGYIKKLIKEDSTYEIVIFINYVKSNLNTVDDVRINETHTFKLERSDIPKLTKITEDEFNLGIKTNLERFEQKLRNKIYILEQSLIELENIN